MECRAKISALKCASVWLLAIVLVAGMCAAPLSLQSQARADEPDLKAVGLLSTQAAGGSIVNEKGQAFSSFASAFSAVPDGGETTLTVRGLSNTASLGDLVIDRNIVVTLRTTESLTTTAKSGVKLSNHAALKLEGTPGKRFGVIGGSVSGNSTLQMDYCTVVGGLGADDSLLELSNVTVRDAQGDSDGWKGSVAFVNGARGSVYKSDINGSVYVGSGCTLDYILDSRVKNSSSKRGNAAVRVEGGKIKRVKNSTLAGVRGVEMKPGQIDYIENTLMIGDVRRDEGRGILMSAASRIESVEQSNIIAKTALECTAEGAGASTRTGIGAIEKTNMRAASDDLVKWKNGAIGEVKLEASLAGSERVVGYGSYYCKAPYLDQRWAFLGLPAGYEWSNSRRSVSTPAEMKASDYRYLVANDCTIAYNANGGAGDMSSDSKTTYLGETEATIANCKFTAPGHAFNGWNTKADGTGKAYKAGSLYKFNEVRHITLYAQWSGTSYTVTFNTQGGSDVTSARVPSGMAVPVPANPTRDNATFSGWYTNRSCADQYRYDFSAPVAGDLTLYAKWVMNDVTVTFDSKGGSAVERQQIAYGTTPSKPADPTLDHFQFRAWYTDEDRTRRFNFSIDKVYDNITLYAGWGEYERSHRWDSGTVTTEPTCTAEGVKTFTCTFDPKRTHVRTEKLPALGHDVEVTEENRVDSTCTTEGSCVRVEKCRRCGQELSHKSVTIPKKAHVTSYQEANEPEPTCSSTGTHWAGQRCTVCGKWTSRMGSELPKTVHSWGAWVRTKEPTEQEGGIETRACGMCGAKETRAISPKPHVHELEHVEGVPATCTDEGVREHWECMSCGQIFADEQASKPLEDETIAALGHGASGTRTENIVAPSCMQEGYHDVVTYCTRCSGELSRETVLDEKIPHTPGEPENENIVAPTCTQEGSHDEVAYCTECGTETSRETVPDKKRDHHVVTERDFYLEATCTEPATHDEIEYCTECFEVYSWKTVEDAPALGHAPAQAVRENEYTATYCNEESHHDEAVYCSRCNDELARSVVSDGRGEKHAEPFEETIEEHAATCTEPGTREDMTYCKACGDILAWEIVETDQALGHDAGDPVRENTLAATCTENGHHDEVAYCTQCDDELSRTTVTDFKLNHAWGAWTAVKEPSETEEGFEQRVCEHDPTHVEGRAIPKVGHVHQSLKHYDAVPSKCDDLGNREFWACVECGRWFADAEGMEPIDDISLIAEPLPPHEPGEKKIENEKSATCTEDGGYDEVVRCKNCNQLLSSSTVATPAHGHDGSVLEIENVLEPTATQPGHYDEVIYCAVCDEELMRETVDEPPTGTDPDEKESSSSSGSGDDSSSSSSSGSGDVSSSSSDSNSRGDAPSSSSAGSSAADGIAGGDEGASGTEASKTTSTTASSSSTANSNASTKAGSTKSGTTSSAAKTPRTGDGLPLAALTLSALALVAVLVMGHAIRRATRR